MKNEQQSQNLLLKVDLRSTFRNNLLEAATNIFVAVKVKNAKHWPKTGNETMLRGTFEGFCSLYFAAFIEPSNATVWVCCRAE